MTEQELYKNKIRPLLIKRGLYFERIELPKRPDIYIAGNNRVLWAELKSINKKQKIIKPDWRIGQLSWMRNHRQLVGELTTVLILNYIGKIYFLKPKKEYKQELICQRQLYLNRLKRKK